MMDSCREAAGEWEGCLVVLWLVEVVLPRDGFVVNWQLQLDISWQPKIWTEMYVDRRFVTWRQFG